VWIFCVCVSVVFCWCSFIWCLYFYVCIFWSYIQYYTFPIKIRWHWNSTICFILAYLLMLWAWFALTKFYFCIPLCLLQNDILMIPSTQLFNILLFYFQLLYRPWLLGHLQMAQYLKSISLLNCHTYILLSLALVQIFTFWCVVNSATYLLISTHYTRVTLYFRLLATSEYTDKTLKKKCHQVNTPWLEKITIFLHYLVWIF
jgi:hypothetical protein